MSKKEYMATANAGAVNFTLTEGQPIELDRDQAKDLRRAGYVVPMKKGLTLTDAKVEAAATRAEYLAEEAAKKAAAEAEQSADEGDENNNPAE